MAKPLLLFAHGAGAGSGHSWMQAWSKRLEAVADVTCFDYAYMARGGRPDRLPALVEQHREALAAMRGRSRRSVLLAGKSMGSRVGCHLAVEDGGVAGLVCFGYPLIGASKRKPVRDAVLLELETPILFVQGTRDKLCPLERLEAVRGRMQAESWLHVVEGGDHSLLVGKRALAAAGETQDDVDARILGAVTRFSAEVAR